MGCGVALQDPCSRPWSRSRSFGSVAQHTDDAGTTAQPSTAAQELAFTAEDSPPPVNNSPPHKTKVPATSADPRLVLDLKAIEAAKDSLDQGAVTLHYGPWRTDVVRWWL